jgi:hypothetical protein
VIRALRPAFPKGGVLGALFGGRHWNVADFAKSSLALKQVIKVRVVDLK